MIERYVFIKLHDRHATPEGRSLVCARAGALGAIPGVLEVRTAVAADEAARASWDVSLVLRFDNLADVERYRVHPDHQAFVDQVVSPMTVVKKVWNFELEPAR